MASERPDLLVHTAPPPVEGADARVLAAASEDGADVEELWARAVGDGEFEVACVPFFTYGLALGDRVRAVWTGAAWELVEVLAWSGHLTYRVWFENADKRAVERALADLGATLEWSSPNLLAIDVADEATAAAVVAELDPRERRGELEWESGQA
jgi:hypothetical protein